MSHQRYTPEFRDEAATGYYAALTEMVVAENDRPQVQHAYKGKPGKQQQAAYGNQVIKVLGTH